MHDRSRAVGRRRATWGRVGAAVAVALGVSGAAVAATALTTVPAGAAGPPPSGIYVANEGGSNVTVYPLPSNGHAPPSATISSSTFQNPYGEAFDAAGDLWVSNYGGDTVAEFTAAQLAATGSPTPAVVLQQYGHIAGRAGRAGLRPCRQPLGGRLHRADAERVHPGSARRLRRAGARR